MLFGLHPRQTPTIRRNFDVTVGTSLALPPCRSIVTLGRKVHVNRVKTAIVALLLASFVGIQPLPAAAQGRNRRDRQEDRWDRREDRRDRREIAGTGATIAIPIGMRPATTAVMIDAIGRGGCIAAI